jgi:hypothetical protein
VPVEIAERAGEADACGGYPSDPRRLRLESAYDLIALVLHPARHENYAPHFADAVENIPAWKRRDDTRVGWSLMGAFTEARSGFGFT